LRPLTAIPAILFAARHPTRVDALVIYAGTARWLAADHYPEGHVTDPTAPLERWNERWGSEANPLAIHAMTPSMAADPRWRRVLGRMQRRAGTPRAAYDYWHNAVVKSNVLGVLGDVRVPALVMHAVGDRNIPFAHGRAIAERIPGARFVKLPGADHLPWFTNGDRLVAETQELLTGSRGLARGIRRLCTVLFTDIVGSTTRAAQLGDERWSDLLSRHDRVLQSHLLRYGGEEISHTGDGALVLFDDPLMALDCARALTQAVDELGLQIRAGLHAGVVEMREGGVAGIAVHIAARVADAAGASEVLVTRTVRDLLLGLGMNLQARGAPELKGVPERMELFALASAAW
jgi:class 3 adenylate cyclase